MSKRTLGDIGHLFGNEDFKRYPRGTFDHVFNMVFDLLYLGYKEGTVAAVALWEPAECPLLYNFEFPDTSANRMLQIVLQGSSVGLTTLHCIHLVQIELIGMLKFDADITEKELEEISIMLVLAEFYNNFFSSEHTPQHLRKFADFANEMCLQETTAKIEKVIEYIKESGAFG